MPTPKNALSLDGQRDTQTDARTDNPTAMSPAAIASEGIKKVLQEKKSSNK